MATTPFIIYTFGNQDIIYETLMSVSSFFGSGTSKGLVRLAGVTLILVFLVNAVGIVTTNPNRPLDLMAFIRFFLLAYIFVYIGTPRDIVIQDVMTNSPKVISTPARSSIPLGVILINSYTSQLFYGLIQAYERYFQTGSSGDISLSYTKSGMAFGSNFVSTLPSATTGDPVFDQNLQNYFGNCGLPIAYSQGGMTNLTQTTDIIGFLSSNWTNIQQARFVAQVDGNGVQSIVDCNTAIQGLKKTWDTNSNSYLSYFAKLAGFSGSQTLIDNFVAAGNSTAAQFLDISSSASDAMKQAIAMNVAYKAIQSNATQVNNSSIALSAYDAQQFQQYKAGGELSGTQAARIVPAIKNFGEQLLYMFYPFMVFYALLAGSFGVVIKYVKFSATINAIPFVYEVLSWGINWYSQNSTSAIATTSGFNLMNASNMYNLNANVVAAANWLSMSVPALAYALISGSDLAITGLFSHATDPGKGTATSTSTDMSKGNLSMGNTQMDNASYNNQSHNNMSANQFNNALDMTMGSPQVNTRFGASTVSNYQDGSSTIQSTISSGAITDQINNALEKQLSQSYSKSIQDTQQSGFDLSNSYKQTSAYAESHGLGKSASHDKGKGVDTNNLVNNSQTNSHDITGVVSGGGSVGTGGGGSGSANLGISARDSHSTTDKYEVDNKVVTSDTNSWKSSDLYKKDQAFKEMVDKTASYQERYSENLSKSQALQEQLQTAQKTSVSQSINTNDEAWRDSLARHGGDAKAAANDFNNQESRREHFNDSKQENIGQSNVNSNLGVNPSNQKQFNEGFNENLNQNKSAANNTVETNVPTILKSGKLEVMEGSTEGINNAVTQTKGSKIVIPDTSNAGKNQLGGDS
jgi:conjugal transfer mating pair stabilization protein TraG